MARKKLKRFAINAERTNVIEEGKEIFNTIKGQWSVHFGNPNPIVLEVGCGKGEYTTGLANVFANKNFIGSDIKGSRIWRGSTVAISANLNNVAFLRTSIDKLADFFDEKEIDEIWITFPDPRPKDKDEKRRLTSERYLNIYKQLLKPNGIIHLKTDSDILYDYTTQLLSQKADEILIHQTTNDLYKSQLIELHYGIMTTFEKKFLALGKTIKYLKFSFK